MPLSRQAGLSTLPGGRPCALRGLIFNQAPVAGRIAHKLPPVARALRPPVPPTGKVPAPGSVLNFYCVKITKPGLTSIRLLALWAVLRTGTLPVGVKGRSALATGGNLCAQRPATGA